jgi:hypothetical protein
MTRDCCVFCISADVMPVSILLQRMKLLVAI